MISNYRIREMQCYTIRSVGQLVTNCDVMVLTSDVMVANEVDAGKVENARQLPV